jgi:hypothetical protein
MFKALACCLTLLAIAVGGPANAQPSANGTHSTDQHDLTLSGSEEIASKLAGSSGQALLTEMEAWVSSQFDLPAIHEHPRIEFAPPAKIAPCVLPTCCPIQEHKLSRTIEPRLLNTTPSPSTTTPREPSICPRAGPAARRPSYPCSFMSWSIIFKMCLGSNTSVHKSVRSSLTSRRIVGLACSDTVWRMTSRSIHSLFL